MNNIKINKSALLQLEDLYKDIIPKENNKPISITLEFNCNIEVAYTQNSIIEIIQKALLEGNNLEKLSTNIADALDVVKKLIPFNQMEFLDSLLIDNNSNTSTVNFVDIKTL